MKDFFKSLFSLKALQLGWAVFWRACLVMMAYGIAALIISLIIGIILGAIKEELAVVGIVIYAALYIYSVILTFQALGWAVIRIKDKLA